MTGRPVVDERFEQEVLKWVGVDSFVLRLLAMAHKLHNSLDEAHEVFCRLRDEGYFSLKTAAAMPRGQAARYYRRVTDEELILERIRLAPKFMLKDRRLAEFVIRDCCSALRQLQPSTEVFVDDGQVHPCSSLLEVYRALAHMLRDYPDLGRDLWDELRRACDELTEDVNRRACRSVVSAFCPTED